MMRPWLFALGILTVVAFATITSASASFLSPTITSWTSSVFHVIEHLTSPPSLQVAAPLEELANIRIPGPPGSNVELLAYKATPSGGDGQDEADNMPLPSIILIHEFFGLNPSIVAKAQGLADDLGCVVVAPDTFRGEATDFIPKAIWLALTTPQQRVNDDLDAVCSYLQGNNDIGAGSTWNRKLAVMGFCYGGGKAIRYTSQSRPDAATVVFYGSPLTDVEKLRRLAAPVCGIYGSKDAQFPMALIDKFRTSLQEAGVENDIRVYEGVGHAFWTDMDQVKKGRQPQTDAYEQCSTFLQRFFRGK